MGESVRVNRRAVRAFLESEPGCEASLTSCGSEDIYKGTFRPDGCSHCANTLFWLRRFAPA
jgi:hypothetical protein